MFFLGPNTQSGWKAPDSLDLTPPPFFNWQALPGRPGTVQAGRAGELGTVPFQIPASWRLRWVLGSSLVLRREDYVKRHAGPFLCLEEGPSLLSVLGALAE